MKLSDWRAQQGLSNADLAERLGLGRRRFETVRRYQLPAGDPDRRIPDQPVMLAIVEATGGAVTPNDFYDLTGIPLSPSEKAEVAA